MGSKDWFIIFTKEGNERKLGSLLNKKGFSTYIPLTVPLNYFKHESSKPRVVFKSFVFVQCSEPDLVTLKKIDGVINFMYWLEKPVIVPANELESLQQFMERCGDVQVQKKQASQPVATELFIQQAEGKEQLVLPTLLVTLRGHSRLRVIYDGIHSLPAVVA
jgi:transcription antitermination factor NusG